jgi:hypothetical protein
MKSNILQINILEDSIPNEDELFLLHDDDENDSFLFANELLLK